MLDQGAACGIEHLHVQPAPLGSMSTEIWTRVVAVSLISTHGDDWGIGITITE